MMPQTENNIDLSNVKDAAAFLLRDNSVIPHLAIVIGSGLGAFLNTIEKTAQFPYATIPHFPVSSVAGHEGEWIFGTSDGNPVIILAGRKHLYEGAGVAACTFAIRLLGELGVRMLILTNAAGALSRHLLPGDLMLIADHINLMFSKPLFPPNPERLFDRLPCSAETYDIRLRKIARDVASAEKIPLKEGIYLGTMGPSYETKAEAQFMKWLGADAVGMSTVLENIAARQLGMRVLGISYISNSVLFPGMQGKITHEEVLANAKLVEVNFAKLMRGVIRAISVSAVVEELHESG